MCIELISTTKNYTITICLVFSLSDDKLMTKNTVKWLGQRFPSFFRFWHILRLFQNLKQKSNFATFFKIS